jgi:hypothetical protein
MKKFKKSKVGGQIVNQNKSGENKGGTQSKYQYA